MWEQTGSTESNKLDTMPWLTFLHFIKWEVSYFEKLDWLVSVIK